MVCEETNKDLEIKLKECISQKNENQKTEIQMKHDLEQLQQQQGEKDGKYKDELLTVNQSAKEHVILCNTLVWYTLIVTPKRTYNKH